MLAQRGQEAGHQDRWIAFPQGRIFARIWGQDGAAPDPIDDTPIILLHDSLGCVELWRGFPALLSATTGRTVIAYDRLGFGKSDPRTDRLSLDFIADEARTYFLELCRQLGIDRFIAMGHSVGGGMAVNCAATFSDQCDALITESAQAFVEDKTLHGISEARELFKQDSQTERLRRYHGDNAEWVLHAWTETRVLNLSYFT
jgi:pimeloyl-ACP methyl ester carboxylesterase